MEIKFYGRDLNFAIKFHLRGSVKFREINAVDYASKFRAPKRTPINLRTPAPQKHCADAASKI